MRIIAGKYKSRRVNSPKTRSNKRDESNLRPTSDRARETLFDVLNNYIEFESLKCLDLFAGTGVLGFEALSRGAESCEFADISKNSLASIKQTGEELDCGDALTLVHADALRYLTDNKTNYFDIIFADPPYSYDNYSQLAEKALALKPQIFVLETSGDNDEIFGSEAYEIVQKKVGSAKFSIFILK